MELPPSFHAIPELDQYIREAQVELTIHFEASWETFALRQNLIGLNLSSVRV